MLFLKFQNCGHSSACAQAKNGNKMQFSNYIASYNSLFSVGYSYFTFITKVNWDTLSGDKTY